MNKPKDGVFRVAGIVGLLALLLVAWMRSTDRNGPDVQAPDVSAGTASSHSHDAPVHHGDGTLTEASPGQPRFLAPSGSLTDGTREVVYEAFQYGFDPDPLVVRTGERIRLKVKSRDVEHGMVVPEIGFNTPMPVGEAKAVEFVVPTKTGEYPIFCSVFCGSGHGAMKGTLIVLPADTKRDSTPKPTNSDSGAEHGYQ